jgi:anti-sigma regulatory factor (Ser/Thr protein kinase)
MAAQRLARGAGFDETDAHRAGLVATEMATNLVKHAAGGGEILLRRIAADAEVELLAIDRGPGMRNVAASSADGHSTTGSPGTGLGAIRRLSDEFDVFSRAPGGTAVFARLRSRSARRATSRAFQVGLVAVAKAGESVTGDGWCVSHSPAAVSVLLADGLGHGVEAADASSAAIAVFTQRPHAKPAEALEAVHLGLRHTRGAAAAVASLNRPSRVVTFAGVGNIGAVITLDGTVRHAVSHNGTLGHEARRFREYTYPWEAGSLLVMHSDGLTSHWSLDVYPGLRMQHPSLVAAVLYRDFSRQRDAVTVLVAREER